MKYERFTLKAFCDVLKRDYEREPTQSQPKEKYILFDLEI